MAAGTSTRFAELVAGDSYQIAARVEVLNPAGAVIFDSAGPTPLDVVGGRVTVDGSASFRRYVSDLVIVDTTGVLVPAAAGDVFSATSGNELRLSVGVIVDGAAEYVTQGIFQLEGARTDDHPDGLTITLSAYDRARRYSRARRVIPRRFDQSASIPIYTAITDLLDDAFPGTAVSHDSPPHLTVEQVCDAGGDPWEFSRALADSMGYHLYVDRLGNIQLRPVPDPATVTAAWTYREGTGSALLAVTRAQSNDAVFSGVVVTGENPSLGAPVRVVIWDDDPASPTYYLGAYGPIPDFFTSDKVRDVTQATAAATGRLNATKGATEIVTFTVTPNPAIEPGDGVRLVRARSKLPESGPGSETLIVDSYSCPLTSGDGPMTIQCRQRRLS